MASAQAQAAQAREAAKLDVGKCYEQLMQAYQKGDFKATAQVYSPNCVILSPGVPVIKGRDGATKYWQRVKETLGVSSIRIVCDEFNGSAEWFFERGTYKLYAAERRLIEERRYVKVWRRWEGKMGIYIYMYQKIPRAAISTPSPSVDSAGANNNIGPAENSVTT